MIKWDEVDKDLNIKLNDWFWINRIGIEDIAKNLSKYFKKLISKEFKLVARGNLGSDLNGYYVRGKNKKYINDVLDDSKMFKKNISIYISEEK